MVRRERAVLSTVGALAVAVALVGCAGQGLGPLLNKAAAPSTASTIPSVAVASCQKSPAVISACVRLGDLTTLDPCGLISLGALPPDLHASPQQRSSLDYCTFDITAGPDKDAVLQLGELESVSDSAAQGESRYDAGGESLQPAGLDLEQSNLHDGECDDALQFEGDLVNLDIDVLVVQGDGTQSLCDAANEVAKALAGVLGSKTQLPHFTVPTDSIAKLQACALLDGAQIGSYTLDGQVDGPSGHGCQWQPDPTDANVEVGIDLKIGTDLDASVADSTSQIHGLRTFTLKYSPSDYSRCEVDTNRAPWGGASGGLAEIASVWAIGEPGQVDTDCSVATGMADVVWPKLPPIS